MVDHPHSPRPDGNRIVDGRGTFPRMRQHILETGSPPLWIDVMVSDTGFSLRYVVPGESTVFQAEFDVNPFDSTVDREVTDQLLGGEFAGALVLLAPLLPEHLAAFADIAPDTRAIPYDEGAVLYIAQNGDVVLWRDRQQASRSDVNAMLDSIPVVNAAGQVAVYVQPTERYAHNVLGDTIEAAALLVLSPAGESLNETTRILLPDDEVFEGLSPFWADIDGDGVDDLVTTVTNARDGARLVVYRADGTVLAESPAIGLGYRWRHQLAFGPFGPNGEYELVEVQTPHLGGIVQFWQYDSQEGRLVLSASILDYTSHAIGSANLDQAVAGDFDGDGIPEIVLTTQRRDALVGLQRSIGGILEVWRLSLDAPPASNFAAVPLPKGRLGLALGLTSKHIHLWLPEN